MVNAHGHATSEFVIVLALLTILGIFFMNSLVGPNGQSGAVNPMQQNAVHKVAKDSD
jgi:hypothetical protein